MSKQVNIISNTNRNDVDVYFSNLKSYIDAHRDVKILNELVCEMNYLLEKNTATNFLSSTFVQQLNEFICYCNNTNKNILLETMNQFKKTNEDATLDQYNQSEYDYLLKQIDSQIKRIETVLGSSNSKSNFIKIITDVTNLIFFINNLIRDISLNKYTGDFVNALNYRLDKINKIKHALSDDKAFNTFYRNLDEANNSVLFNNINDNKNTMKKQDTISIQEVKRLINEVINETLHNEINYLIPDPSDPQDSIDDFAGDYLDDLTDTVNNLIAKVKNDTDDDGKAYNQLVKIYEKLTNAIDNPRLTSSQRKQLEHDYEGILGKIHSVIGGGGSVEKFYMREELMESSDKFSVYYQEKNPSSVSKTGGWCIAATFADKNSAEKFARDPKNQQEYGEMDVEKYDPDYDLDENSFKQLSHGKISDSEKKAAASNKNWLKNPDKYKGLRKDVDIAFKKLEKDKNNSLSECGSWEEAKQHPLFKQAVLTEKAPPGMESWIKANKQKFIDQYGKEKGMSVLYATAWKMFYNKQK